MKKSLFLLFICMMFLVTGCGNQDEDSSNSNDGTLTCTKEEKNDDGYNVKDTMVITYKDNMVTKVEETNIEEMDADLLEMTLTFGQAFANAFDAIDGIDASYEKESDTSIKYVMTIDYGKLDLDALKDMFGDDFDEDSFYSEVNITIDDFKADNLSDYTCK